ncbi:Multidrug resistance protein NorM [compost metagenome]
MSICLALTILVGYEAGASRLKDAKQFALIGISTALALSLMNAVILMFFREYVAAIYSNDSEVIALITHFLIYAIFFQLSDAIATPIQGVLRGYKDVNPAFWITLLAYWIIGLPLGYVLANYTSQGPYGFWLGLIIGLGIAALMLFQRLFTVQRRMQLQLKEGNRMP